MLVGYASGSPGNEDLDLQRRALEDAGCEEVYEDCVSGIARRRPQLDAALERIQPGDTLIVCRLDRIGRSLNFIVRLLEWTGQVQINFRSLAEQIDTATTRGRLILPVMGALAEFERTLIAERSRAGLDAARRRGVKTGRPRKLADHDLALARNLLETGAETRAGVARLLAVDPKTLRRALVADGF